ncbi:hypothetical protein [Glaciibacter psychrotolerans]|nr:hypothetical protein [Leifsonia psychrotolerans]
MRLATIRSVSLPGARAFQSSLVSIFVMAAVILGLLAMHTAGADHFDSPVAAVAGTHESPRAASADASDLIAGPLVASTAAVVLIAASSVIDCDESCVQGALSCMVVIMSCVMLVVRALTASLAKRPALSRQLLDAGARLNLTARHVSSRFVNPDLTALSISRT